MEYEKKYPASNKEWSNSIYSYNKNSVKLLTTYDKLVLKLINGYFNFYDSKSIDEKYNTSKKRRLSIKKIFLSKAELRHTNSSVIITLYVYNAQERYLVRKLKRIDPAFKTTDESYLYRIEKIKSQLEKQVSIINKINYLHLDTVKSLNIIKDFKIFFIEKLNIDDLYSNFVKKYLKKEMLTMEYKRLLYLNRSKFENTRLLAFNELVNKIYDKKVQFNLINLKYIHLNSDILLQAIAIKLNKRKNRLLKVLTKAIKLVKLPLTINRYDMSGNINKINKTFLLHKVKSFNFYTLLNNINLANGTDKLNTLLNEIYLSTQKNKYSSSLETRVISNLKYKSINGIRLESSGRLNRRFTAARSIFKLKYNGSLKTLDSSYKGLSSPILRGHVKSNVQYTKLNDKNRNGSFGLKG